MRDQHCTTASTTPWHAERIGHVGPQGEAVPTRRLQLVGRAAQRLRPAPRKGDATALLREGDGRGGADAAARAGDHGDLAVHPSHDALLRLERVSLPHRFAAVARGPTSPPA